MKYLLDTDHLSILQRESSADRNRILEHIAACNSEDIAVSIVSFHEQALGFNALVARAKTVEQVVEGYDLFQNLLHRYANARVIEFDLRAAEALVRLKSRKVRLKLMDLRIAATALVHDLTLVSRNSVDFERVPNLRIEDWTK
jgi:tRNA(fMet)-specific endonuclease VapC